MFPPPSRFLPLVLQLRAYVVSSLNVMPRASDPLSMAKTILRVWYAILQSGGVARWRSGSSLVCDEWARCELKLNYGYIAAVSAELVVSGHSGS